jgi:hypothetical protein
MACCGQKRQEIRTQATPVADNPGKIAGAQESSFLSARNPFRKCRQDGSHRYRAYVRAAKPVWRPWRGRAGGSTLETRTETITSGIERWCFRCAA